MIDPHFWESAQIKGWTSEDCTVMLAAISAADDEGRGRVKSITDNISGIISTRKFKKSCQNLGDSIIFYSKPVQNCNRNDKKNSKLFYFLPSFNIYQKVSHPSKSKFPDPKVFINNNLDLKNSRNIPESFWNDSTTVKVSLNKFSLNKFKVGEEPPTNNANSSNDDLPLPFLTQNKNTEPSDYSNVFEVTDCIKNLLSIHCNIEEPDKATLSSFANMVTSTKQVRNQTAFKLLRDTFYEYNTLPDEKRNLKYVYSRAKGKINDALTRAKEDRAKREKDVEKKESESVNNPDILQLTNNFKIN